MTSMHMKSKSLICHLLIGPPGSGKTTFARELQKCLPDAEIVCTDDIRTELWGDPSIQGLWTEVEALVIQRIRSKVMEGHPAIYDATNIKRWWRMNLLQNLELPQVMWIAWVLKTPLKSCLDWNQQRQRQVSPGVIENLYIELNRFKPVAAEGFLSVQELDPSCLLDTNAVISQRLALVKAGAKNRVNRYAQNELHGYSRLLDFDRLMHLIALLLRYPGLGGLCQQEPKLLLEALKTSQLPFSIEPVAEVTAVMEAQVSGLYADADALTQDLEWLEENSFLGVRDSSSALVLPPFEGDVDFAHHAYSDRDSFYRLMSTLRFISHHPLSQESLVLQMREEGRLEGKNASRLKLLTMQMKESGILDAEIMPMLRKDIERVFHPFQIFPHASLRKGYYLGTGVLNTSDLLGVYQLAQKQVEGLDDVLARATVQRFEERLRWAQYDLENLYSVRAIASGNIVNSRLLSREVLAAEEKACELEADIRQGQQIRVGRRKGAAGFDHQPSEEDIWPLQILFNSIAWYVGYQVAGGAQVGLYCYERLDRLYRVRSNAERRSIKAQRQALQNLEKLRGCSAGIFLGADAAEQQGFLRLSSSERFNSMETLELRFTQSMFEFVSEGTQRFPIEQMEMSKPVNSFVSRSPDMKNLFRLPAEPSDPTHPNRMKVKLPRWSFQDVTLKAWILGLGDGVKVIQPKEYRDWIARELQEAAAFYADL